MKLRLGINPKLTVVFVLFAALLLVSVGIPSYNNGRAALKAAAIAELLSTAIEKQAALNTWVKERAYDVSVMASSGHIHDEVVTLTGLEQSDAKAPEAHDHLVQDLLPRVEGGIEFLELMVLDPQTGRVVVSTKASEEGKFKENMPFFMMGKKADYIQNTYYSPSLRAPAMTASAPIVTADGKVVGVLAARINLDEMKSIITRRSGLRQTDDAYLVNTSSLFVTQPRFISNPAVLQRGAQTEAVRRCLARDSGVVSADDYRGIPVLTVYRWLPERELCLVVELDQSEALAPTRLLGQTTTAIGVLALLVASVLAFGLARTLTRPILALKESASRIGHGELDHPVEIHSSDEIGQLGKVFDEMAANLKCSQEETSRRQQLVAALGQAAQAVQHAQTPANVYQTVGDEVMRLGYQAIICTFENDRAALTITHLTFEERLLQEFEGAAGFAMPGYCFPLVSQGMFDQVISERQPLHLAQAGLFIAEWMPDFNLSLAARLAEILRVEQAVCAPMVVADDSIGLLIVTGSGLTLADMPAVAVFASQAAITLENTRLYQKTLQWAAELERRVQERTQALHKSEQKYRSLFENAQIGIYRFTLDGGRLLDANATFAAIYGYRVEEILAVPAVFLWGGQTQREVLMQAVRENRLLTDYELNIVTHTGATRICLASVRLNDDEDCLEGTLLDITDRKTAENDLEQRSEELARSNADLQQFAYVASHDLQEPLRMVSSYTQLLARRYKGKLDADADEFIGYAVDGANRMQRLIQDLLAYSRLGSRFKDFAPTNCETVLAHVLANLQMAIDESGAQITHDPLPIVMSDELQLAQLFQNLVSNAMKFRGPEPVKIHLSANFAENRWVFSVRDNGIGIAPEYFDRIFIIFQRLHGRDQYPGTGIGLAICKKIVERHHGQIWVESIPEQGATFFFTIPAWKGPISLSTEIV